MLALVFAASACSSGAGSEKAKPATYTGVASEDIVESLRVNDMTKFSKLIDADGSLLEFKDSGGRTILHLAVRYNRPAMVNLLIDKGMDPNIKDATEATPLASLEESGLRAEDARKAIIKRGGKS